MEQKNNNNKQLEKYDKKLQKKPTYIQRGRDNKALLQENLRKQEEYDYKILQQQQILNQEFLKEVRLGHDVNEKLEKEYNNKLLLQENLRKQEEYENKILLENINKLQEEYNNNINIQQQETFNHQQQTDENILLQENINKLQKEYNNNLLLQENLHSQEEYDNKILRENFNKLQEEYHNKRIQHDLKRELVYNTIEAYNNKQLQYRQRAIILKEDGCSNYEIKETKIIKNIYLLTISSVTHTTEQGYTPPVLIHPFMMNVPYVPKINKDKTYFYRERSVIAGEIGGMKGSKNKGCTRPIIKQNTMLHKILNAIGKELQKEGFINKTH